MVLGKDDKRLKAVRLRELKREELLQLLANGKHVTEIAEEKRVCRVALGQKLKSICQNLGARGREHAVAIAMRKGMIQ